MSSPIPRELLPLGAEECFELLEAAPWVRVGFHVDGLPTILPVNIVRHEGDFFFRTAPGSKLGTAADGGTVAIQADGGDVDERVGWSVLLRGEAHIVTDPALEESLLALPFEPWALPDDRHFWVRIRPGTITGRRIARP